MVRRHIAWPPSMPLVNCCLRLGCSHARGIGHWVDCQAMVILTQTPPGQACLVRGAGPVRCNRRH